MTLTRRLLALAALLVSLTACGGHGGGSGTSTSTPAPTQPPNPAPTLTNFASLVVDAGPAALQVGPNGYIDANIPFVSVTLCVPNTTTCQTIDHIQVDTGSEGLRIAQGVLSASLLAAMPMEIDPSANPVGECYQFVDGYVFGSVRQADFQIGGETVAGMPFQSIGDGGAFAGVPASCSSGGGSNLVTVQDLNANGVIGIGTIATDCAAVCTMAGGSGAAIYYDCPSSGCATIITRAASTTAPFEQLINPVAGMSVDNNGSIVSLPSISASGQATAAGTLYFGIGTQTNNSLGAATILTTTTSDSPLGGGLITAIYEGQILPDSFIDSGSTLYFFSDNNLPLCSGASYEGYYCPMSPTALSPTLQGANGVGNASAAFTLNNAQTLLSSGNSALAGLGGNPQALGIANPYPTSFDFGLPFFYGRQIYTAIEGRSAGGSVGPFYAY